jgi:hypothetical protein
VGDNVRAKRFELRQLKAGKFAGDDHPGLRHSAREDRSRRSSARGFAPRSSCSRSAGSADGHGGRCLRAERFEDGAKRPASGSRGGVEEDSQRTGGTSAGDRD